MINESELKRWMVDILADFNDLTYNEALEYITDKEIYLAIDLIHEIVQELVQDINVDTSNY